VIKPTWLDPPAKSILHKEQLIMSTALPQLPGWYIEFQASLLRQAPRPGEIDQTTAEGWMNNQGSLKKTLAGSLLPSSTATLFEFVGLVTIPATSGKFVARKKFVVNTKCNAPVKISAVWVNFAKWFLSGDGKIEKPIGEQTLRCHKLLKVSVDGPIINELGGEAKAETTLTEMFSLMEKQKNGKGGVLLNNSCANIFYIRDQNGLLRAVYVLWRGDGWLICARSVESPNMWLDGRRVFSRNSVLKSSEPSAPAQA